MNFHEKQIIYHLQELAKGYANEMQKLKSQVDLLQDSSKRDLKETYFDIELPIFIKDGERGDKRRLLLKDFSNFPWSWNSSDYLKNYIEQNNLEFAHKEISDNDIDEIIKKFEISQKDIVEKNAEEIRKAKERADAVNSLLLTLGVPKTVPDNKSRAWFKPSIPNPILDDVYRAVYTAQLPNLKNSYTPEDFANKISDIRGKVKELLNVYRSIQNEKDKQLEKARKEEEKEKIFLSVLADSGYNVRNGIPSKEKLFDFVLSKNKYLYLGYFLMKNREDWSDGPSYAKIGLNNFEIETELDIEIDKEIQGHIIDWGGDGRIFRDCHYNYTFLIELAKKQAPVAYGLYEKLLTII